MTSSYLRGSFHILLKLLVTLGLLGLVVPMSWAATVTVKKPGTEAAANVEMLAPTLVRKPSPKSCPALKPIPIAGAPGNIGRDLVQWDRCDDQLLLLVVVNAANDKGVAITNVKKGDQIIVSVWGGTASFDEDNGSPKLAGLVGVVAKGAEVASTGLGHPELIPVIESANQFAQEQFKAPKDNAKKRRDAFGVEPGTGLKARGEGGVVICMPANGGLSFSGDRDHQERWIRKPGDRVDKNIPSTASGCFFPIRGNNPANFRKVRQTGDGVSLLAVGAWDWKFSDNKGSYLIFVKIEKAGTKQSDPNVSIVK